MKRTDRFNRVFLAFVGLLMIGVGMGGIGLRDGWFGNLRPRRPVLDPEIQRFVAENTWFWLAVAGAALWFGLLGYALLKRQVPGSPPTKDFDVTRRRAGGITRVRPHALDEAVARDVEHLDGVQVAHARLVSASPPVVDIHLRVDDGVSIEGVRKDVEQEILGHLRQCLEVDDARAKLHFFMAPRDSRVLR